MDRRRMGLSTFLWPGMGPGRWISLAGELGLGWVELRADPGAVYPPDLDGAGRRRLRELLEGRGLRATVHAPIYGINLSSPYPALAAAALGEVLGAVDLARDLGAERLIVHPGGVDPDYLQLDGARELALRRFTWALELILRRAGDLPVALENKQRGRAWEMVYTPDDHRGFLERFPGLGACLDVGHLHTVGGDVAAYVRALGDRLVHLHLHDNRGSGDDHLGLGEGTLDWRGVVSALEEAGYAGPVILEIPDPEALRRSVALLERA
ncbi:MAG: sugar phosphate isomerase/epimerase [Candidatus Bipolaricaulota bacterium]|nr:sugar phosphate isomerase/epimerase [Candidatus Bipolaricaulota bacterium]